MSALTVRQRQALRYATLKSEGDRDLRAAEAHQHAQSSTPNLQRIVESPRGITVLLIVGLALFALFAPVGNW
ncbi:hypothetical protein [Luteibacter yeojuensis]|uniref:Uncharacterized protein n=1 Tax=Luteibacter yeojuensis TaxID=345309 RepID=A0A7X5TQE3_9GAMM|nr:hypothetical protein [Luteibacter yeojuensis]NID15422.1 hypothetical protein [Luteibacter yeojuensis]